jgi:hypothetical protein
MVACFFYCDLLLVQAKLIEAYIFWKKKKWFKLMYQSRLCVRWCLCETKVLYVCILFQFCVYIYIHVVGPCHHDMACPQVADRGMASDKELRINSISSRGQPTRGGSPAWGLGEVLTTPPCKTIILWNIHMRDACSGSGGHLWVR